MGCSLDDKADPHHDSKNIEDNPEIPLLNKSHSHQCLGYHTEHRCESVYPRLACIGIFKKQSDDNRADDTNCRNDNQLGHRETAGFETFLCRSSPLSPLPQPHELHRKIVQGIHRSIAVSSGFEGNIGIKSDLYGAEKEIPHIALGCQNHANNSGYGCDKADYVIFRSGNRIDDVAQDNPQYQHPVEDAH